MIIIFEHLLCSLCKYYSTEKCKLGNERNKSSMFGGTKINVMSWRAERSGFLLLGRR